MKQPMKGNFKRYVDQHSAWKTLTRIKVIDHKAFTQTFDIDRGAGRGMLEFLPLDKTRISTKAHFPRRICSRRTVKK
jgi:hypothetical protein